MTREELRPLEKTTSELRAALSGLDTHDLPPLQARALLIRAQRELVAGDARSSSTARWEQLCLLIASAVHLASALRVAWFR
ncbi:MAG: hypothetical protein RL385_2583 [Pseudomonadota bacterium]|jgi:hypothetical protein